MNTTSRQHVAMILRKAADTLSASVLRASDHMQVAKTIMEQLGGQRKFQMMTGAKKFVAFSAEHGGPGLMIGFPNKRGPNGVRIDLTPADTYKVTFFKGNNKVKEFDDIYADDLISLFEKNTGLYLSL